MLWSTKARHGWVFWKNQKGRSSWGFRFVSITIYNLLIRINIFHCSKTGGSSTKQTHLDHWKVPKHGRLEIIFHVAKSDYGSWPKLGVISQFFYMHRFSSSRLQHDRCGHCGHAGVKRRKLRMWMRTDVLQSLTLCRPSLLRWGTLYTCSFFRPQICRLLNSWFERIGCIQFYYHLPSSFPRGKALTFRRSKSIKCPMSMYIRSLGGFNHWYIGEESDEISWN